MAIGTALAIGATVAGSALSSKSKSKAAGKAADTSLAVADKNNALARDIYGQNKSILNPYVERGNAAGGAMNALLGLGGTQQAPAVQPNALSQFRGGPSPQQAYGTADGFYSDLGGGQFSPALYADMYPQVGSSFRHDRSSMGMPGYAPGGFTGSPSYTGTPYNPGATAGSPGGQSAQGAASNAFDIFKNSTGYQFRVNEGQDALNSGYAGAGLLQSGAALKGLDDYRQGMASQEFGNYMGYLGNQQGVGLSAGSALAGVGQNFASSVGANNTAAGNAAANAALIKGQNNPFANALGTLGGGILGLGG